MTFMGTNYNSEMGQTKDNLSDGAETPPPNYEHSLTMKEESNANVFQN